MSKSANDNKPDLNQRKSRIYNLVWLTVISVFTLIVYKNIYSGDFFLDDYLHLHLVQRIQNPFLPFITNLFMGAFFRPGVFIFWKINHLLFGLNVGGYYATNMLFLILLVLFLFFVLYNVTGNRRFSGIAAGLFAFSPVTCVGVLWLSNRFDLIGATFYMLSLLLFLKHLRTGKRSQYIWAIVTGLFSYFCKEMMVTLPVVMVICASFMFGYRAKLTQDRFYKIVILATPFFSLGVLFILWRYGIIHSLGGYAGEIKVKITPQYLFQLYSGFADYFWLFRSKLILTMFIIAFLLLIAKTDFVRNNPLTVFGLAIAIVTSVPLVMVFKLKAVMLYMTPRFFFLPSVGGTIALASVFDPRSGKVRKVFATVFLVPIMMLFMANTFVNVHKWVEDRHENLRNIRKVATHIEEISPTIESGKIFYVLLYGNDVALDAGMKIRYPQFLDKFYFLNPRGPTQVIGTKELHDNKGKMLNWPNTFDLNPCVFENLYYGVVDVIPRDIVEQLNQSNDVFLIAKDKMGKMVAADREGINNLLATFGVLKYD